MQVCTETFFILSAKHRYRTKKRDNKKNQEELLALFAYTLAIVVPDENEVLVTLTFDPLT